VGIILIIFLGINWPNFGYFKHYRQIGPTFLSVSSSHECVSLILGSSSALHVLRRALQIHIYLLKYSTTTRLVIMTK